MATPPPPPPDAYLASLSVRQQTLFRRLVCLLGRPGRTLATYFTCAGLIAALQPAGAGYGAGWVKELCGALDRAGTPVSPSLAYRLIRFALLYPGPEGTTRVRKLDGRVSWEVMLRVVHVEDEDKREAILRRAADGGLSSRAVMAFIRETTGYRRGRGGRPAARVSTHPNRALRELRALASKWAAVSEAWSGTGNNALRRAGRLKPAQVTGAFLTELSAVVPLVEEMARTAGHLAEELSGLLLTLREREAGHRRE